MLKLPFGVGFDAMPTEMAAAIKQRSPSMTYTFSFESETFTRTAEGSFGLCAVTW
jgi:hypothetical protein